MATGPTSVSGVFSITNGSVSDNDARVYMWTGLDVPIPSGTQGAPYRTGYAGTCERMRPTPPLVT